MNEAPRRESSTKRRTLRMVLGFVALATMAGAWLGCSRPLPCRSQHHFSALERKWEAWHRGEVSDGQLLKELLHYATLKPPFWGKSTAYSGVNWKATDHLAELKTPEAFDALCRLMTCPDRHLNAVAALAVGKRGDKRALPFLMALLELEDKRARTVVETIMPGHYLVTCNVLDVIVRLGGSDALPGLKAFVAAKRRVYEHEVQEIIFGLEHDTDDLVNIGQHVVTVKLQKNRFLAGESVLLDYSITCHVVSRLNPFSKFGDTILIDGKMIRQRSPSVHRGGFSCRTSVPLAGLSPGQHALTVAITGSDKSASQVFHVTEEKNGQ